MKKQFQFFVLTIAIAFAFVQTALSQFNEREKVISVNDIRRLGVSHYDTSTTGHILGEITVDRSLSLKHKYSDAKKDTNDVYQVHFFKMYENKLRNYQVSYHGDEEFDKASYKWLNDTIVSVTLINSTTNKSRNLKLVQTFCKGCSAGLMDESLDGKK